MLLASYTAVSDQVVQRYGSVRQVVLVQAAEQLPKGFVFSAGDLEVVGGDECVDPLVVVTPDRTFLQAMP
ncbi:hypothetical protein [Streptomyces qaidamensis]|nr:hypothetical protein [Streptomyces qaidamensis]